MFSTKLFNSRELHCTDDTLFYFSFCKMYFPVPILLCIWPCKLTNYYVNDQSISSAHNLSIDQLQTAGCCTCYPRGHRWLTVAVVGRVYWLGDVFILCVVSLFKWLPQNYSYHYLILMNFIWKLLTCVAMFL